MKRKSAGWIVVGMLIIIINVSRFFPVLVEEYYSNGVYVLTSRLQRIVFGWLPFSIGDLVYAGAVIYIVIKLKLIIKQKIKKNITWRNVGIKGLGFVKTLLWTYVLFYFLWGMNYYRQGIAVQLNLQPEYGQTDIAELLDAIVIKLNEARLLISKDTVLPEPPFAQLTQGVTESYDEATKKFPFLAYDFLSAKKSMYSSVAQYMGFTGYFNPLTGEAQVRSVLPNVMQPFILCHEAAHQLGYGSEAEANFTGFIAASSSTNAYFRYSAYLDMYSIVRNKLFFTMLQNRVDSSVIISSFKNYNTSLDTLVRFDKRKIREYFTGVQTGLSNNTSNAVMGFYDAYLKVNKQVKGVESYADVTGWLIAYRKKYGKI